MVKYNRWIAIFLYFQPNFGGTTLPPIIADLLLLLVALIWGLTFPAIKDALEAVTPFIFLALRFFIAWVFLIILYPHKLIKINRINFKTGLIIGTLLFLGYGFQTIGIQYTSASNAAFITGLSVVLVPFLNIPVTGELPGKYAVIGALSATVGLSLLSLNASLTLNFGDVLVFLCAIAFAYQIILVGKYAPHTDPTLLTIIQIGVVAIFSGLAAASFETLSVSFTRQVWIGLAICAIPATSLAYWIQNKAQKYTSPAKTAIIFSMEPVFGALFSYLWLGETLTLKGVLGCVLVFFGIVLAELGTK